jgi:ATPase family associated with various cellular activities (AAA)
VTTPEPAPAPEATDLRGLARGLRELVDLAARTLRDEAGPSELGQRVIDHLGCELSEVVPVTERFPIWEHVNVQRGVDAYLAAYGSDGAWIGLSGAIHRPHENMLALINASPPFGAAMVSAAIYGTAPVGPDENTEVVTLGLIMTSAPDGKPVVIGMRAEREFGPPYCRLEVLAADRSAAAAARDEIERLIRAHDVFRGQVLSFSESEHHGNELVSFLPRPTVTAQDVVLPDGVLENIEGHVLGIADWAQELLGAGQHLKRGLLLHGPPGTGKTHTVRYLTGRLTGTTIILLTGLSIRFIDQAAILARRLQPSMVVLEDVDLVGMDRDFTEGSNPLLFSLLEAMDGVGADADVTFVLTTNRADILEIALADRPGRVDLAIEIPRPNAECRERLLKVYARDLVIDADLGEVVAGTDGVTASFIKEMIRRTVLVSLRAGERPPVLRGSHFTEVLAEMNGEHHALTRSLLGVGAGSDNGPGESAGPTPGLLARHPRPRPTHRRFLGDVT